MGLGHNIVGLGHETGTQWDWDTTRLELNGTGTQRDWNSMGLGHNIVGLGHNETGTQWDWDTTRLELNGTGTQRDWNSTGLRHNGTETQRDWDTTGLELNGTETQRAEPLVVTGRTVVFQTQGAGLQADVTLTEGVCLLISFRRQCL